MIFLEYGICAYTYILGLFLPASIGGLNFRVDRLKLDKNQITETQGHATFHLIESQHPSGI